jgi:WD40 repeat protein
MENLMKNSGRLSALYESRVAVQAKTLVDQYAQKVLKTPRKAQSHSEVTKDLLDKERDTATKEIPQPLIESQAKVKTNEDKASLSARLSAVMKGKSSNSVLICSKLITIARWDSGEMHIVTARKKDKFARRKAAEQAIRSYSNPVPLKTSDVRSHPVQFQSISISSSSTDGDDKSHPANDQSSSSHLEKVSSVRRPALRSNIAQGSFRARQPIQPLSQIRKTRVGPQASIRPRPTISIRSIASTQEVANLRIAAIDDRMPRPYLSSTHREDVVRGLAAARGESQSKAGLTAREVSLLQGSVMHVDFSHDEIEPLLRIIESIRGPAQTIKALNSKKRLESLMKGRKSMIPKIVNALVSFGNVSDPSKRSPLVPSRTQAAIIDFLEDAAVDRISKEAKITRLELSLGLPQGTPENDESITEMLRERETWGRRSQYRGARSIKARILSHMEDELVRDAEWTDSSGDIATISWIDGDRFVCGATAHSDEHNMQYNKPGNLLIGSVIGKELKSVSGHQVVRPIVTKGENSTASMRGTQDPWMYCSVTSTAYSPDNKKCFTGSYDQTVKVWNVTEDGASVEICATWSHSGNVNFVVASPHHTMIATAADVCEDAVRVYDLNPDDVSASVYRCFEPSIQERNGNDTWAYFPATLQWGISPNVSHLLLVGYSPRSFDCDESDIPEDKSNTGELCLWDARDSTRIPITSARTQNVFEVVWHPSQPIFVAATSPTGIYEDSVRTQLRLFGQTRNGAFSHMKTLDCPAIDINEITIMSVVFYSLFFSVLLC